MSRFLRPEALATLHRWRGILISGAIMALGLFGAFYSYAIMSWLSGAVALAGGASLIAAGQRLRFDTRSGGPGVVKVDEGAIAYFGPLTGGVVARSEMTALAIDRSGKPVHWALSQPGQPDLMIPLGASGAEALFDAFAALPGMRTERMLSEMHNPRDGQSRVLLWQKPGIQPTHLHLN